MENKRNYILDFWKFIFAVLVVLFHSRNIIVEESDRIFVNGRIGVEFFFLVSGCMMAFSAARSNEPSIAKDTVAFIKRKFFMLMPNMIIAHIIAFSVYHFSKNITSVSVLATHFVQSLPEMFFIKNSAIVGVNYNGVTWYLSSMLLMMAILYPLLRHFGDRFVSIIAPIGLLFLGGYLFRTYGSLSDLESWNGWIFTSNLRAVVDLLGGVVCYKVATILRKYTFKSWMRVVFTLIELGCYIGGITYTYSHEPGKSDYVILALFMIGIIITVSQCGIASWMNDSKFFGRIFGWLGKFSFSLYLGHSFWRQYYINTFLKTWSFRNRMIFYLTASVITGLFIMYTSIALRALWKKLKPKITRAMLLGDKKTENTSAKG